MGLRSGSNKPSAITSLNIGASQGERGSEQQRQEAEGEHIIEGWLADGCFASWARAVSLPRERRCTERRTSRVLCLTCTPTYTSEITTAAAPSASATALTASKFTTVEDRAKDYGETLVGLPESATPNCLEPEYHR